MRVRSTLHTNLHSSGAGRFSTITVRIVDALNALLSSYRAGRRGGRTVSISFAGVRKDAKAILVTFSSSSLNSLPVGKWAVGT